MRSQWLSRRGRRLLVATCAVAMLAACARETGWSSIKAEIRDQFPAVPQMSVEELAALLAEDRPPYLIDVREPEEYAVSHLRGAVNARGKSVRELLEELEPGRGTVLYCSVGYRSSAEARALIESGITGVWNLDGSIFEWANSGHPVFREGQRVEEVHPYDEAWGRLLDERFRSYGAGGTPASPPP